MQAGAVFGDLGEIVGPGVVNSAEGDSAGEIGIAGDFAGEDFLPFCLNAMALTFERHFVFVEHDARIEVLAFDQALDGCGVVVIARVEVMIFDEQIVFGGDEETGAAGIALTSGTAAELVIDAAAFVFVGADDVKTAEGGDAIAKFDVGAASGHVGRDGDPLWPRSRLRVHRSWH